ncbi:hypothetical protein CEXT_189491 [Caerostris extrusa]|uniref:Uncharacterized protein n=1 Tax=Caerostris extrusa TaxID=172846 RepID=A0AAV4XKD7_CAEEX|nr:hypothetical protein CEXT_189491 [Caerostris extrusa]
MRYINTARHRELRIIPLANIGLSNNPKTRIPPPNDIDNLPLSPRTSRGGTDHVTTTHRFESGRAITEAIPILCSLIQFSKC